MKSIYLVLDMQNDLVHENGLGGGSPLAEQVRLRSVIDATARALAKARSAQVRVGFVRVGFSDDYRECPTRSALFGGVRRGGLLKLGSWGAEVHPALDQSPQDLAVVKHRVSPFYSTTLEAQLRALAVERIFCSGVSTQAVVQATVRDAHDRDYDVVVVEDACAAHSQAEHQNSIESIRRFCTITDSLHVEFAS